MSFSGIHCRKISQSHRAVKIRTLECLESGFTGQVYNHAKLAISCDAELCKKCVIDELAKLHLGTNNNNLIKYELDFRNIFRERKWL